MKLVVPNTKWREAGLRLAARPATLKDKVVGFLDGWGFRAEDGTISMYPLMRELRTLLAERYQISTFIWLKKPNVAQRAPRDQIAALLKADVVVNGEAA